MAVDESNRLGAWQHYDCILRGLTANNHFSHRAINGGSPYNVPAGHGSMNLEKVVAKYQQDFHNEEAAKLERLKARGEW